MQHSFLEKMDWEKILPRFQNPGRYSGAEYSAYTPKENTKRFLLAFPDDYSIGMSSLGYHTVGNIIHSHLEFSCERAFAPAKDMEDWMRSNEVPLFSLETKTPASSFEIIGFSMQYELSFTNFINMLKLSGIEPRRTSRNEAPLILGGGPSFANPALLSEFFDIIILGEAEEVLGEVLSLYAAESDRKLFLEKASKMGGVFVPGLSDKGVFSVFKNFDNRYYPTAPPVAITQSAHARINLEINRGCRNLCRFCQASAIYSPYREKKVDDLVEAAEEAIANTGYDEIALTSLSGTDHSEIMRLLDQLHYSFKDMGVSAVMSSMRPSHFASRLSGRIARLRKGGITFAPETPSRRLKKIIGKDIPSEEIIDAAVEASRLGWKKIKLYFMIGIPQETENDIEEIISFISEVKKRSRLQITASVSPLVPQPHTAFQWLRSEDPDILFRKAEHIRKNAPARVSRFDKGQYIIENIFSRADSSLADILLSALNKGCRFDQWSEHFNFRLWEEAFKENGSSWQEYYYRDFDIDADLPWDMISVGVKKTFLKNSYKRIIGEKE